MSLTAQTISTFIAALALSLAIHLPAPQENRGNSTIRGVVTYADTGRPVRYATVTVLGNDAEAWSGNAVTNRRGEFELERVPAGRYIVFVNSPGVLRPNVFPSYGPVSAQLRLAGESFTEAVVNGTDSVDVKVHAVRGGVITGRVVTEDDQPVANADISLFKRENGKWTPFGRRSGGSDSSDKQFKTDPSGVYRVAGLVAGEYVVRVSEGVVHDDGRSQPEQGAYPAGFFMAIYYPAASNLNDAQAVRVIEGGESTGVDIRMPDRAAHTISGTVRFGKDNEPAAFAEIFVERPDEIEYRDSEPLPTTRADENGKWEVLGVPAGEYSIRIGGSVRVGPPDSDYINVASERVRVRVEYDDVIVPDTKLSRGGAISGRVILDGKPPKRFMQVFAQPVSDKQMSKAAVYHRRTPVSDLQNGYVGPDGTFWIVGLPPGKYAVSVSVLDIGECYVKAITRKGVDLTKSPLKVEDESVIEDVAISLGSDLATIEGQLATPDAPAKKIDFRDAVVILASANDATRRFSRGLLMAQPDAEGKFVISCAPGEYFLAALTSAEIKQRAAPIDENYFKEDNQKFERVKVKAGEKVKRLTVPVGSN